MRNRKDRRAGFTLIELLLVVVIIGILAAIVVPKLVGRTEDANLTRAKGDLKTLNTMLSAYEVDNGNFPTTEQGLQALVEKPTGSPEPKKWKGPYLQPAEVPKDGWGNAYEYKCPGDKNPNGYDLYCIGKDGQAGTEDDIWN
jgi:general secretion pathway protein G